MPRLLHLIAVLASATLALPSAELDDTRVEELMQAAGSLDAAAIERAEASLAADGDQADLRLKLYAAYSEDAFRHPQHAQAALPHLLWLAEHHPAVSVLGWSQVMLQLEGPDLQRVVDALAAASEQRPDEPDIHLNIGRLLARADADRAERAFRAAIELDADHAEAIGELGSLLFQRMESAGPGARRRELATSAAERLARANELDDDPNNRFYRMNDLAWATYESGDLAAARRRAQELLTAAEQHRQDWNHGNAIFDGHSVLGACAYSQGDVETAAAELVASASTPGSPQLDSFGPDFSLAAVLVAAGEDQAVTTFLEGVAEFWEFDQGQTQRWIATLRGGGQPEFPRTRHQIAEPAAE